MAAITSGCSYDLWPNPFQIRWSAYAYVADRFGIKVFMFFSKNYLIRIFFFCFIKISCVQRYRKIPIKFFQCNFQTATVSPFFYAFKRVTHNFTQFWSLFHVLCYLKKKKIKNAQVIHFLLKNALFRKMHFSR